MNNVLKRYLKPAVALLGVGILALFAFKTFDLLGHRPPPPSLAGLSAEAASAVEMNHVTELTKFGNQLTRSSFFALIGLFLSLLAVLPKSKRWVPKLLFSSGLMALILYHLLADGKLAAIAKDGVNLSLPWLLAAFLAQAAAMTCTIFRWKTLLEGQGFRVPLRHLVESFLIGRFIGSFSPGTTGLDGYRAYDIARYTGKTARSISVIVVEKLIGFLVLGTLLLAAVPIGRELLATRDVNQSALYAMGLLFLGMMAAPTALLFSPGIVRRIADRFVPKRSPLRGPLDKIIRAVTAYEKRKLHLAKATLIGFGVHLFTIVLYFCTLRALGLAIPMSHVFATSAMTIGAIVLPLAIAGIGMREGVFVFFLGPLAALAAFAAYVVGEAISLLGGPVWLARRSDYYEVIKAQQNAINADVEDDDTDDLDAPLDALAQGPLPSLRDYTLTGLGAGLVAALCVALVDSSRLWLVGGAVDLTVPGYAAAVYGPLLGLLGGALGLVLAFFGRLAAVPAAPKTKTATFIGGSLFFVLSLVVAFFYVHRDVFGEKAGLGNPRFLAYIAGSAVAVLVAAVGSAAIIRRLGQLGDKLCHWKIAAAIYALSTAALLAVGLLHGEPQTNAAAGPTPQPGQPNVVLVMVDTARADHVGAYGDPRGLTPHLDALAQDGVVFSNTFAQSSWTRPSVATILTGRFPSSHTAVLKGSVLPEEITTLAETMTASGYESLGLVTNYNLTPFFNFDQGFHRYRYLAPDMPLWSSDTQSKLVVIEVWKKIAAKLAGSKERPQDYYVTGDVVTREALTQLDARDKQRPFFQFLSYMDPHDPYFRHPFDGFAISHRADANPDPAVLPQMKDLYAQEMRFWDQSFGALVDGLKQRGLYDDTLVIVVSDHGEEFGEHGGYWHGTTLYDEQLRVIFVAKLPSRLGLKGAVVPDWMRLVDVAPFILDSVGLPIPQEMQGVPRPLSAATPVFAEEDHQGNILTSVRLKTDGQEIKLIKANKGNPRGVAESELYRTDEDPNERTNLAESHAKLMETANQELEARAIEAKKGAASAVSGELSAEAKKTLGNLGYMDDEKK